MSDELATLLMQRDLCRRYAEGASNPSAAQKLLDIADEYERRAASLQAMRLER